MRRSCSPAEFKLWTFFPLLSLSSSHSSFSVSLQLYLICSSPPRLPRSYSHFSHSPRSCLASSITFRLFFLRSTCVFSRTGEREEDGLRRWAWYWLSFVFLICFISVCCWEEGRGGDAKTMRSSADYLARLPVKSVSLLHY